MKDQSKFAKKHLGQNFLISPEVRDHILKEAGDLKDKKVLEIGPGLGFLTEELLKAGAILTAIELDERAFKILQKQFGAYENFTLLNQDILQTDLDNLFKEAPYCVIANIPYNITNPIIRKLLEKTKNKPEFALLMVQKEVAQKICDPVSTRTTNYQLELDSGALPKNFQTLDKPENEKKAISKILSIPLQGASAANLKSKIPNSKSASRSILSIAVEVYAEAKYCFTVGRELFEPAPKVDSAIMKLTVLKKPLITPEQQRDFFTVVNAGFSEKRKKIGNVLGKFFGVPSDQLLGNIDANRRAETLTIDEWLELTDNFRKAL